jgi:hypothetical protein
VQPFDQLNLSRANIAQTDMTKVRGSAAVEPPTGCTTAC